MAPDTPDQSGESAPRKLLILAIDAGEPALLRAWAGDGTLPHIAAMMEEGLVGRCYRKGDLCLGTPWPSFSTGTNPGEHGIYWFDQLRPGTYRTRRTTPADLDRPKALWDVLADAGRRVVVIDVPFTRLTPRPGGTQVVEWGVHDGLFGFQADPPALTRVILDSIGRHPAPVACDRPDRTTAEYSAFTDQLVSGAVARANLTRTILAREPWDFAIQVFSEAHCAGHQLWHFHDPAHPAHNLRSTAAEGDLLRTVYMAIDSAVGEVLASVDSNTTVVLMSLHGMTFAAGGGLLMDDILARLGVMTPASSAPNGTGLRTIRPSLPRRAVRLARHIYHLLPQQLRLPLYRARAHISQQWLGRGVPLGIDPTRSRCFKIEMGQTVSGIRLNLAGREPHGILAPGVEAEQFCEQLIQDLSDIVNPDTGRRLITRVAKSADLYHGQQMGGLPDLVVEWDLEEPLGTTAVRPGDGASKKAWSPRLGLVERVNHNCRTGEHLIEGMFVARGPGISPGRLPAPVGTLDFAPTFARILGCEMPSVDGHVIEELVPSHCSTAKHAEPATDTMSDSG